MSTITDLPGHDESGATPPTPTDRRRGRTWWIAVVAVAALVAGAGVALAVVRPWEDASGFCSRIEALPALDGSVAADGTPARSLAAYADGLDAAATAAPDGEVADAARTIAAYERRLAGLVGGELSPSGVVTGTASLDRDAAALDAARDRLDRATSRC